MMIERLTDFRRVYAGIGVTVITERVAEDENTHFYNSGSKLLYKHKSIWQSLFNIIILLQSVG